MPDPARARRSAAGRQSRVPRATAGRQSSARREAAVSRPARRPPIAKPVRILFLDVDGTLTDGVIGFTRDSDLRHFWVRDGLALEWARDLGMLTVVISGRSSQAVAARMADLKLEHYLGVKDKVAVAERVLQREHASWDECAMVGDDLPDVPLLKRVGWPIAVSDAAPQVMRFARTVTRARAGFGAVREVAEMLLQHNGVWHRVLERYEVT